MKLNSPRFLSKQQKRIVQEVQLQLSEICDFDLEIPSIERGFPLILNFFVATVRAAILKRH